MRAAEQALGIVPGTQDLPGRRCILLPDSPSLGIEGTIHSGVTLGAILMDTGSGRQWNHCPHFTLWLKKSLEAPPPDIAEGHAAAWGPNWVWIQLSNFQRPSARSFFVPVPKGKGGQSCGFPL